VLEAAVAFDGLLEIGDLFPGNIAGNIPAVFVALVVVIGPGGALANNADAPPVHALNQGDVFKDGFYSEFGAHGADVYAIDIYPATKRTAILH
jgi:hypothetical protein